jgi:hypothetical protein
MLRASTRLWVTLLAIGALADAGAQSFYAIRNERSLILSAGTGTSTYLGELSNPGDYLDARPNLNLGLQLFVTRRIAVRSEITWFQLRGDDAKANSDRVERNLSFSSNNYELTASGLLHLFPLGRRFYQRPLFNVYAFAGVGMVTINPTTMYQGERVALQPLQTEGVAYSRVQPVVPYGLGVMLKQGPYLNIALEGGLRMLFTDYLDDVSVRRYPDPATLGSPLAVALSDRRRERDPDYPVAPNLGVRGNPERNDGYFLLNLKVQYYLPVRLSQNTAQRRLYNKKRNAFYRYNKGGSLKRRR